MAQWFIAFVVLSLTLGFNSPAAAFTNLTPQEAYNQLQENPAAVLLDVRTIDEWLNVGHPGQDADDPSYGAFLDSRVFHIPWQEPRGTDNDKFGMVVTKLFELADPIFAFCRSGSRSVSSCQRLETLGFTNAYNILYGFEGRTSNEVFFKGWRDEDLPWNKSASDVWPAALLVAQTPLPASWPLMASGLGLVAVWGVRRRRS